MNNIKLPEHLDIFVAHGCAEQNDDGSEMIEYPPNLYGIFFLVGMEFQIGMDLYGSPQLKIQLAQSHFEEIRDQLQKHPDYLAALDRLQESRREFNSQVDRAQQARKDMQVRLKAEKEKEGV